MWFIGKSSKQGKTSKFEDFKGETHFLPSGLYDKVTIGPFPTNGNCLIEGGFKK